MPYWDRSGRACGFLDLEPHEGTNHFVRRYFVLNDKQGRFDYFMDSPLNLPDGSGPVGSIDLTFLSMVDKGSGSRPKEPLTLYLTVAGKKYFLRANDYEDRDQWINTLRNASKISVPKMEESQDKQPHSSYTAEIAGGVVIRRFKEAEDELSSSCEELDMERLNYVHHSNPVKLGYCTKQGFRVKSWKRRWFVLDEDGISYFKTAEEKTPIRVIKMSEIYESRVSRGVHPNRENVFEIVTSQRVFYVQPDSQREMDDWIFQINQQKSNFSFGHLVSTAVSSSLQGNVAAPHVEWYS